MRAVSVVNPGSDFTAAVRVGDVPEPVAGPGEVLIEVEACAVCRTDLQIASGELAARRLPVIPGHQVVGRVAASGGGVADPVVGQRVGLVWLAGTCGACRFCQSGRENLCLSAQFTGWDRDGGWAERVTARADFAHPMGAGDATDVAPLLCGGVIGYRALRVAGVGPTGAGMRVGLFGFGASATISLQLARFWGATVFVVTRSASEVSRARELGATWAGTYDDAIPELLDAAVTFAPAGRVVLQALQACDRGAAVAINAIHLDGIPAFDYGDLWWERSLRSVANVTRSDVREFLALVEPAGIRTQTEVLDLAAAPTALERLRAGQVSGAFVLVP